MHYMIKYLYLDPLFFYSNPVDKFMRHALRNLTGFFLFLALLFAYGHFIERNRLTVQSIEIENDALADIFAGQTLVQISDIHVTDQPDGLLKKLSARLEEINPDFLFLTGDYLQWFAGQPAIEQTRSFLSGLSARQGIFAVFGDADYSSGPRHCKLFHSKEDSLWLARLPVRFLRDENVRISVNGRPVDIIGLDISKNQQHIRNSVDALLDSVPAIILSHTSLVYNQLPADKNVLVLSGNTHGGQVLLPIWVWRLIGRKADARHMYGHFRNGKKNLFVSDGIGTSQIDLRLAVPPQIAVIKFIKERR